MSAKSWPSTPGALSRGDLDETAHCLAWNAAEADPLPHLICSRPIFFGGVENEADQHDDA